MTAWPDEAAAIGNMIDNFGTVGLMLGGGG
jgi:hypothetical protein